ncbi:MAG: ABC transporter substrate-binding protein, partial [Caldilineaceae bacterium]
MSRFIRWTLAATVIALLAGCAAPAAQPAEAEVAAPAEAAAPGEPVAGGILVVGTPQEPASLNPALATSSIEDAIGSLFVEGLVEVGADGNYAPVLAEALPAVSEDGLQVTYTIREGVTFSNGDPLECADVQFTLDVILSDLSQAGTAGYRDIDSIDCPDARTVVVNFVQLYAPYLRLFSYILPRAAGDIAALDTWEFNRAPIGTGPWTVQEWKTGDSMTLAPNPNYREEGKPYLETVVIRVLPSREVGMQLLGTGEIGVLWDLTEADF